VKSVHKNIPMTQCKSPQHGHLKLVETLAFNGKDLSQT
jgi:hypothetical protein